jgi:CUG-BP- and ETR3-like factor
LRGPDGANLFVFHIPNTMTNQDLYHLFSQYGNILSATIKTEAKTGRGRGFGFVNYDSAEAASRAIHHLNGASVNISICTQAPIMLLTSFFCSFR